VKEAIKGGGVAILVPPGSARGEVAKRLVDEMAVDDVLLYEDLHRRLGVGRPLRVEDGQFYVGKEPLLQYIMGGATLVSEPKKVVIVPRDTWEALLIREALLKALKEERGGGGAKVKILFLPALYQESDREAAELANVDYGDVLKGVVKNARGISPSLARLAKEREAGGDLIHLITDVRALVPGQSVSALYELAGEVAGGLASEAARGAAEAVPGVLTAGAALAVMGLNPLAIAAGAAAGWAARKIVDKLWELLGKARGRRADVAKDVWTLLQLAKSVYPSLCPRERAEELERLETVVDEVAAKWGMSIGQFKDFVCNLGALTTSRVVTVEELEERLKRLEELVLLRASAPTAVYVEAWEWPYVAEVGEGLAVLEGSVKGPYVETRLEEVLLKRLEAAVESARRGAGSIVLLRGPKGVGKSTAAAAALYKLLKRGKAAVAVFDLGAAVDEARTAQFLSEARRRGLAPVLYLDPSRLEFYTSYTLARHPIARAAENLAKLVELAKRHSAVALVVLSEDQAETIARSEELGEEVKKMLLSDVDVVKVGDVLEVEPFVKALVEKYSGCSNGVVKKIADAIASSFKDGYALAAVLAADWLKRGGCRGEEAAEAVERARGDVHRFVLHYLWYGLFNGSGAVANRYAPLLLAVGFFGPHPPKLAKAVVEAFGGEPEDAVVKWLSQPLHGTLYEAIEKVAHGAVYRRYGVGSDELCQGSVEGPCRLVEICSGRLVGVPRKGYSGVVEVAEEYAKIIAEKLKAPGPDRVRQINFLIDDFLQAYNGVAEDGRWKIRYETKGPEGVKTVEDVVDELDILSALYGLAVVPGWDPRLKPLKDWFFVGGRKVGVVGLYLYLLLRERSGELVKRAVVIVSEAGRRDGYTYVDLLRSVGIAVAGQWGSATDEEVKEAVELAATALLLFATVSPILLEHVESLLSEAWRRVVSGGAYEDRERRQRLADKLTRGAHNVAIGHPLSLLHFFAVAIDKLDPKVAVHPFDALYDAASNAGKRLLLDVLLYALGWNIGGVNVAAVLLGDPQLERWRAFEEVARRVEKLVSQLGGVERAYVIIRLYPALAARYTSFGNFDKAVKLVEETLEALKELWKAYGEDKASTEEMLRPHLELTWVKPDLGKELNDLSQNVYHHVARVYLGADVLNKAVEYAEKACEIARKLGNVHDEVASCGLLLRLKAVKSGVPPVGELEELWRRASQSVEELGAEAIATTLGKYVVALVSAGRLSEVEKVLEKWGWALELHPDTSALTYGVLSLFDERHLGKAVEHLPEQAKADLPKFADGLHDAVEVGLLTKIPEIVMTAMETLMVVYGDDVVMALHEVASTSSKLFLSTLVGLAYCKDGKEWGLKLARAAAWAGSRFKGIDGRLFRELAEALKMAAVGNWVTDEVLKAVYKLYYFYI